MGGEEKAEGLRGDVFKLSSIVENWLLLVDRLREPLTQEEIGPAFALFYTLIMLKNLYFLQSPGWDQLRDTVNLGLVKDTKKYGNTSVSMGAAVKVLGKGDSKNVGFLNGGTGGVKYQYYSSEGGLVHVVGEYKPKDAPMPSCLKIANYSPKTAVSFEESNEALVRNLSASELPWNPKEVPMFAFVTGTIRQHWEEAKPDEKKLLEQEMTKLFEPHGIKPLGSSYFIPQDDEGTFELLGARALYSNLVANGLLDPGIEIVGSFGIGRGSCQWMIMQKSGVPELVPHKAGMTNLPELSKLSKTLMEAYTPEKFRGVLESFQGIANPTIALKSGATLLMEMKQFAHIKPELTAKRTFEKCTVRVATVTAKDKVKEITWKGSLDHMCALATFELGSEEELCTIYRENEEGKLQRISRTTPAKQGELLLLGPVVIHGSGIPEPVVATVSSSSAASATTATTNAAAKSKSESSQKRQCVLL